MFDAIRAAVDAAELEHQNGQELRTLAADLGEALAWLVYEIDNRGLADKLETYKLADRVNSRYFWEVCGGGEQFAKDNASPDVLEEGRAFNGASETWDQIV